MPASEAPASVLRRAAEKLRNEATAAKELTGDGNGKWFPWGVVRETEWREFPEPRPVPVPFAFDDSTEMATGQHEPTGRAFVAYSVYAHDQEEDWHEAEFIGSAIPEPIARYMASMGPHLGLALADWLDALAGQAEQSGTWALHSLSPGPLAVARAYLNEENDDAG